MDVDALLATETRWLQRLARRLLADEATADDVAQDAALLALAKRPDFGGNRRQARGWLRAVVGRLAQATRRKSAQRNAREDEAARRRAIRAADNRLELHEILVGAVRSLAEPYRSTVVMRFFDEHSTREISRLQGVTQAAVRQRLARALQQLRDRLERRFGARETWRRALAPLAAAPGASWSAAVLYVGSVVMKSKKLAFAAALLTVGVVGLTGYYGSAPGGGPAPPEDRGALTAPDGTAETAASEDVDRPSLHREVVAVTGQEAVLRGHVTVGGRAPDAPVELRLRLATEGDRPAPELSVSTGARGAFRFQVLDTAWSGELSWPEPYRLRPDSPLADESFVWWVRKGIHVGHDHGDLLLDLIRLPHVRLRFVWADTGEPVPRIGGMAQVGLEAGDLVRPVNFGAYRGVRADDEGVMIVTAEPEEEWEPMALLDTDARPRIPALRLSVRDPDRGIDQEVRFGPEDLRGGEELVVRLARPSIRRHFFEVVDGRGEPVAGARFYRVDLVECTPTDESGRGSLRIRDDLRPECLLGAPGHGMRVVQLRRHPGTRAAPWRFVLPRGTLLHLRVRRTDGGPVDAFRLALRHRGELVLRTGPRDLPVPVGAGGTPRRAHGPGPGLYGGGEGRRRFGPSRP